VNLAALPRRAVTRARTYSVGVIIRWRWLASTIAPYLEGRTVQVLDAGCGDGTYALRLAKRYPRASFQGVDVMEERLARARQRLAAERPPNLAFSYGDLTRNQGEQKYDVIYSIDVFEHIDDDRAALASLSRALKPRGRLLLHTPLSPQRHWLKRFDLDHLHRDDHVREGYTVADLQEKAREVGLQPTGVHYTHGRWGTLAWELWRLTREHLWSRVVAWPVIRLLIALEFVGPHAWGNCVLFEATKPG
jgi:ubiquinone/menaquinone biosynthesis C-methylase UbiE